MNHNKSLTLLKKSFTVLCFVIFAQNSCADSPFGDFIKEQYDNHTAKHGQSELKLLLPINVPQKKELMVSIPKNYKQVPDKEATEKTKKTEKTEKTEATKDKHRSTVQFAGTEEGEGVLTITTDRGSRVPAKFLTEKMVTHLKQTIGKVKVLKQNDKKHQHYNASVKILLVDGKDGRQSLWYVKAVSGPYDSAFIQFLIGVEKQETVEKQMVKAEAFVDEHIKML